MRFNAQITNISTFTKFAASLSTLGHIAWLRLDSTDIRFTVIPGTQVWSVLAIDSIFETYNIQSAAEGNAINLEVPLAPLQRALKSAQNAIAASIRLTKKDGMPLLSLTITTMAMSHAPPPSSAGYGGNARNSREPSYAPSNYPNGNGNASSFNPEDFHEEAITFNGPDRETLITQDIPIRVLAPASIEGLHEPRCREPDVHIVLPNLIQLKSISDRFTRLATSAGSEQKFSTRGGFASANSSGPKLELSANMHGCLRLSLAHSALHISSLWTGLENPELDPAQATASLDEHPSTRMKALGDSMGRGEEGWATVRIEGKDWGKVLSVGRLGGRVIACFCHDHALILYVFLEPDGPGGGESVLTVSATYDRLSWT